MKQGIEAIDESQLIEDVNACARYVWAEHLNIFAEECFPQHLTLSMPGYHADIYRALSSLILDPITPPKAFENTISPAPKSLQFSNFPMVKDHKKDDGIRYRNSVVVEPREFGKSTKAMIYVMWNIVNSYKKFILYISKSFDHAVKLVGPIKREFESNEMIGDVYGNLCADKWTESEMEFSNGSKLLAVGRGQTVRGLKFLNWRPDLVVLDDIEDDESVNNSELRLKLHEWLDKQVIPGVDSRRGNISVFGTILHPDSLLSNISTSRNRLEKYQSFKTLFFKALDENEKSIWEEKFSTFNLLEEKRKDPYSFAQERMNEPIPLGSGMFKKEYFRYFTLEDGYIFEGGRRIKLSDCNLYLTCDIAMTTREYSDYTVLLVSAVSPKNQIFFLEYTRARWEDPDKIIAEMFRLNSKYNIKVNGVEEVAAQRWLIVNLRKEMERKNHFFSLVGLKADKDKLRRISQLQPRFENGSVFLRNTMSEFEEELLLFPKAAHDDISDAAAYLIQLARPGEPEEEPKTLRDRPAYRFSVDGDEVLKRLMTRTEPKGIFKEYKNGDDFDPYKEDSFEDAIIRKWTEED